MIKQMKSLSLSTGAALLLSSSIVFSAFNAQAGEIAVKGGDKIAFLGDSITAEGRGPGGYCQLVLLALKDLAPVQIQL